MGNFASPQGQMGQGQAPTTNPFMSALLNSAGGMQGLQQMLGQARQGQQSQGFQMPAAQWKNGVQQAPDLSRMPKEMMGVQNNGNVLPQNLAASFGQADPAAVQRFNQLRLGADPAFMSGTKNWAQSLAGQALGMNNMAGGDYDSPQVQALLYHALGANGFADAMSAHAQGEGRYQGIRDQWMNMLGPSVQAPGGGSQTSPFGPMQATMGNVAEMPQMQGMAGMQGGKPMQGVMQGLQGTLGGVIGGMANQQTNPLQQMNAMQNGMMQRQPAATMNGMPLPQDKILGGRAGMKNPFTPNL